MNNNLYIKSIKSFPKNFIKYWEQWFKDLRYPIRYIFENFKLLLMAIFFPLVFLCLFPFTPIIKKKTDEESIKQMDKRKMEMLKNYGGDKYAKSKNSNIL